MFTLKRSTMMLITKIAYAMGVVMLVGGMALGAFVKPVQAESTNWDKSSLYFDSGFGCQGNCTEIRAKVCNGGDAMMGPAVYEVYFSASGNPKPAPQGTGTKIGDGLISALPSTNPDSCEIITFTPTQSGNYTFRALQRAGHPGQGDLWSDQCSVTCSVPPTATKTAVPPTATFTPVPPTATSTSVPPTATNTAVPPTATFTPTVVVPEITVVPPTATNTVVPPTATNTVVPPTPTSTSSVPEITPVPPTATSTPSVPQVSATPDIIKTATKVSTLPPPAVVTSQPLIPVTGSDFLQPGNALGALQGSLMNLGMITMGLALVLHGITLKLGKE